MCATDIDVSCLTLPRRIMSWNSVSETLFKSSRSARTDGIEGCCVGLERLAFSPVALWRARDIGFRERLVSCRDCFKLQSTPNKSYRYSVFTAQLHQQRLYHCVCWMVIFLIVRTHTPPAPSRPILFRNVLFLVLKYTSHVCNVLLLAIYESLECHVPYVCFKIPSSLKMSHICWVS